MSPSPQHAQMAPTRTPPVTIPKTLLRAEMCAWFDTVFKHVGLSLRAYGESFNPQTSSMVFVLCSFAP